MNTVCPGCGIQQPSSGQTSENRYNCSFECWDLFGQLSAYTLSHRGGTFIHQHAVDAWQAQHIGPASSNIGAAFSLIGLYLALEKGYTGRQVQIVHMELGKFKRDWPKLECPSVAATLTVMDVLNADRGEQRDAMLMKWAAAVWASWSHAHGWTKQYCAQHLKIT
jgi:hypothetical protein